MRWLLAFFLASSEMAKANLVPLQAAGHRWRENRRRCRRRALKYRKYRAAVISPSATASAAAALSEIAAVCKRRGADAARVLPV